jgi:sulfur carrier protein
MMCIAMNITVNGKIITLEGPHTIAEMLQHLGLSEAPCAVEVNRDLVPRREHANRTLCEGDEIEIVTLVGGG